jgi:hypothetical protein
MVLMHKILNFIFILYLLYYKMDTNQMLLLIIALFLIYHMTSICGDGFTNLGNSTDPNKFREYSSCNIPDGQDCDQYYIKSGTNYLNEPDYYGCIKEKSKDSNCKKSNRCIDSGKCPSCGDLSNYTLMGTDGFSASMCTSNLDTCKKCLNNENNVTMSVFNNHYGRYNITSPYTTICGKSGKYTECDETKSKCTDDLQQILTDTMNSSGNCSIQELYTEIQNASGELSLNCNGNNNIHGEEAWLDEALSSVGDEYCKPNNNTWKCNRDDIPSYCKNGQCVLTGDTNNKKCSCPEGTVPLNNGKCGKVTCTPGRRVRGVDPRIDKCPIDKKCVFVPAGGIFPGEGSLKCV